MGCPSPRPFHLYAHPQSAISLALLYWWEIFIWNTLCLFSWLLLLTAGISCFIHVRIPSVRIFHRLHYPRPSIFCSSTVRRGSSLLVHFGKPRLGITVMLRILLGSAAGTCAEESGCLALRQAGALGSGVLGAHASIPLASRQTRQTPRDGLLVAMAPVVFFWRGLCLIVLHWRWPP